MKEGSTVILRNAKIDMYKGSMRLAVDKWGRVEVTEPAASSVKEDNNLSLIDFELITRAIYLQLTNGVHVYTGVLSWVRRLWVLISSRTKEQCVGFVGPVSFPSKRLDFMSRINMPSNRDAVEDLTRMRCSRLDILLNCTKALDNVLEARLGNEESCVCGGKIA
ncbi:hypothetical protein M8C21_032656, partial [Ambrosia artemisiifolia]